MENIKILKINIEKDYFSILLHDETEKLDFWIDCGIMDGYGNKKDYKTQDLYIDWTFNQYIFDLNNEKDIAAKEYQENGENIDRIQDAIDKKNDEILNYIKKEGVKNEI